MSHKSLQTLRGTWNGLKTALYKSLSSLVNWTGRIWYPRYPAWQILRTQKTRFQAKTSMAQMYSKPHRDKVRKPKLRKACMTNMAAKPVDGARQPKTKSRHATWKTMLWMGSHRPVHPGPGRTASTPGDIPVHGKVVGVKMSPGVGAVDPDSSNMFRLHCMALVISVSPGVFHFKDKFLLSVKRKYM